MTDKIAVLLPCYNEEKAIEKVIKDFKKYLPKAEIYVYDNNSTDNTAEIALKAGAIVRREPMQGKGNVVRRMFADIDADIYVMSDGDETYDIKRASELIKTLKENQIDMLVGARKEKEQECYRAGHRFGNVLLTKLVQTFFKHKLKDMLSGYRVFSKRFVKTFPAQSLGFEIETELTVYALSAKLPIMEVDTDYFARPEGSFSKLSTYKDGIRILKTIITLVKEERPLLFFSLIALFFFALAFGLSVPIVTEYLKSGLVPRLPTAVLITGIAICSVVCMLVGFILDSIASAKKEARRQAYLRYPFDLTLRK